jgi:hypothetical protein
MAATERLCLLLADEEVTYGTPVVPALTDARAARDFTDYDVEFGTIDKMWTRPTRISGGKDVGALFRKVELEWAVSGPDAGAPDVLAPRWGIFMKACEMSETDIGAGPITGKTYAFTSRANQTSLTLEFYEFYQGSLVARKIIIPGVRLAWEFSVAVNEAALWKFSGAGLFQGAPTERTFTGGDMTTIDYGADGEQCDSANGKAIVLTIGGVSLNAKSVSLKTNRKVETQEDVTATYGIAACYVTADKGAVFELEVDPVIDDIATLDFWADILAQTLKAMTIQIDTANGARLTFTIPGAQTLEFSREDDKGLIRRKQMIYPVDCDSDAGDTALSLAVTRTP